MLKKHFKKFNGKQRIYLAVLAIVIIIIILLSLLLVYFLLIKPAADRGRIAVNYLPLTEEQLGAENYKIYTDAVATLSKDPHHLGSLLNLGYFYFNVKEYDEADKVFNQYLKIDPYDTEVLLGLSRVKVAQGKYQEAEKFYYELVKISPLYMIAYQELLGLYQQKSLPPNPQYIEALRHAMDKDKNKEYDQKIRSLLQDYNLIPKE